MDLKDLICPIVKSVPQCLKRLFDDIELFDIINSFNVAKQLLSPWVQSKRFGSREHLFLNKVGCSERSSIYLNDQVNAGEEESKLAEGLIMSIITDN